MAEFVRIDSYTKHITLDGVSRMTVRASNLGWPGNVNFQVRMVINGVSWTYPELRADGVFVFVPDLSLLRGIPNDTDGSCEVVVSLVKDGEVLDHTGVVILVSVGVDAAKPVLSEGWVRIRPYNSHTLYPDSVYVKGGGLMAEFDLSRVGFRYGASAAELWEGLWRVRVGGRDVISDGMVFNGDELTINIPASGEIEVVCGVMDSRGLTASETFVITAYEYAQPALSGIEIYRSDAGGNALDTGAFIRVKADAGVSGLGGANDIAELYVEFAPTGAETPVRTDIESGVPMLLGAGSVIPARSYRVGIHLFDRCGGNAKYETVISTIGAAFNILPGGNGAAFGRLAEKEKTLDVCDWDIETEGNIRAANLHPVGSVYMSAYDADPAAMFGGYWNEVTTTNLPFKVWYRVPD